MKFFSKMKIKYKFILSSYFVVMPLVLLVNGYTYYQDRSRTSQELTEGYAQLAASLYESVQGLQTDMENILTYVSVNGEIRLLLSENALERYGDQPLVWKKSAPMELLQDMIAVKSHICNLIIYPENGMPTYYLSTDGSVMHTKLEEIMDTPLYRRESQVSSDLFLSRQEAGSSGLFLSNKKDKLVLSRFLYDLARKKKIAFLAVTIDAERYEELCRGVIKSDREGVLICNQFGEVLASAGTVDEKVQSYLQSMEYAENRSMVSETDYEDWKILSYGKEGRNEIVYFVVSKNIWGDQTKVMLWSVALLTLVFLAAVFPLSILGSRIITQQLQKLHLSMQKFETGDFTQHVDITYEDEIGEVIACYNHMVCDIKKLIDLNYIMEIKEKESELIALQAQINPHFLYNTLDSLYWQALEAGSEELAEDIFALSQLFRMVLGQGKAFISLRDEKELLYNYLQIQKMRFSQKLTYELDFEEEILDCRIPKLILQPFVENAIVHGLEQTKIMGKILVSGWQEDGYLCFQVSDNGTGMTKEQIDQLFIADPKEYAGQRVGRYAIKNVRERLELKYGQDFELNVTSSPGKGTKIDIRIPKEEETRHDHTGGQKNGC